MQATRYNIYLLLVSVKSSRSSLVSCHSSIFSRLDPSSCDMHGGRASNNIRPTVHISLVLRAVTRRRRVTAIHTALHTCWQGHDGSRRDTVVRRGLVYLRSERIVSAWFRFWHVVLCIENSVCQAFPPHMITWTLFYRARSLEQRLENPNVAIDSCCIINTTCNALRKKSGCID